MDTIRGRFLKQHLLSDEFLDLIEKNKRPMDELMSYYQCAIMVSVWASSSWSVRASTITLSFSPRRITRTPEP